MDQLDAHPVHIKVGNVRVLANILQAIKHSAKQVRVTVSILGQQATHTLLYPTGTLCALRVMGWARQSRSSIVQACTMILTDDGMTIGWEGDGKSMQSSVYLKKAVSPTGSPCHCCHIVKR